MADSMKGHVKLTTNNATLVGSIKYVRHVLLGSSLLASLEPACFL